MNRDVKNILRCWTPHLHRNFQNKLTVHSSDLLQSLGFHKHQTSTNSPYVLWGYFSYWCPNWYNGRQAADLFLVFNLVPR